MRSNSSTSNCEFPHAVAKGKRTKRKRALLPTSSGSSVESKGATEEDEDMANCLILLAQGRDLDAPKEAEKSLTSRRYSEASTTTIEKTRLDHVYECKTCNKCFSSFQALGGHRASHKKPKMAVIPTVAATIEDDSLSISMNSFTKPIGRVNNNKLRVHECSICGSEFTSGQALGGHMRRHRLVVVPEDHEGRKERNFLSLDLNLPAPSEDDHGEFERSPAVGMSFSGNRPMVFAAATPLVDCYY